MILIIISYFVVVQISLKLIWLLISHIYCLMNGLIVVWNFAMGWMSCLVSCILYFLILLCRFIIDNCVAVSFELRLLHLCRKIFIIKILIVLCFVQILINNIYCVQHNVSSSLYWILNAWCHCCILNVLNIWSVTDCPVTSIWIWTHLSIHYNLIICLSIILLMVIINSSIIFWRNYVILAHFRSSWKASWFSLVRFICSCLGLRMHIYLLIDLIRL